MIDEAKNAFKSETGTKNDNGLLFAGSNTKENNKEIETSTKINRKSEMDAIQQKKVDNNINIVKSIKKSEINDNAFLN